MTFTGYGHSRNHDESVCILQGDVSCRLCGLASKTVKYVFHIRSEGSLQPGEDVNAGSRYKILYLVKFTGVGTV